VQLFIGHILSTTEAALSEDESWHCVKVLRHKTGDAITMMDGKGNYYSCTIIDANPKKCSLRINSSDFLKDPVPYKLHIAIAPTKNIDRIEWFVEKAVEIGIGEISFIHCKNSERRIIKTDRVEKIVESACKQSLQRYLPKVNELKDFAVFLKDTPVSENNFIAHCQISGLPQYTKLVKPKGDVLFLIGPEGDFTMSEVTLAKERGFKELSLGTNRLRTETAALFVCNAMAVLSSLYPGSDQP
jgi:16S rRNA (uracil1498-N3)-methyltransferase